MTGSSPSSLPRTVILTGPTAVGKSGFAFEFARDHELEIINADSVCFYQGFNIGSAKPTPEELAQVPHHLINNANPNDNYHAGQFLKDCTLILSKIHARGKRAMIVGGSGFYLKSLRLGLWEAPATSPEFRETLEPKTNAELFEKLKNVDSAHANKIGVNDRYRIIRALEIIELGGKRPSDLEGAMPTETNPNFELWVVDRDKDELSARIRARIDQMLAAGFLDEVKELREKYPDSKTLCAVGYQQVIDYFDGVKPDGRQAPNGLPGLKDEIELAHRQLAKQQRTWIKNLKANETFVLDNDLSVLKEKLMKFYQ